MAAPAVASLIALAIHVAISWPWGLLAAPYGVVAVAIAWPSARVLWAFLTTRGGAPASATSLLLAHFGALLVAAVLAPVVVDGGLAVYRLMTEGSTGSWAPWGGFAGVIPVVIAYALVSLSTAANLRRRVADPTA